MLEAGHIYLGKCPSHGSVWVALLLLDVLFGKFTGAFKVKRFSYEIRHRLPGFNTIEYNYKEWSHYDWSREGNEWNDSESWKHSIVEIFIRKYFQPGKHILEIGPGAGRWSVALAKIAKQLWLVDLTEEALEYCRKRLAQFSHCHFIYGNGRDIPEIEPASIDYIWSFDVFVHISPRDAESYIQEFARILKVNGIGIIHHPANGGHRGGFRSSITNDLFLTLLKQNSFKVTEQFSRWGKDGNFNVEKFDDRITVFEKF